MTSLATHWSVTRLRAWHRCARLHHYRYGLGLDEPPTDVMAFGSAGHVALEMDLRALRGEATGPLPALADPYEAARLGAVLDGYRIRWEQTRWEVLGAEVPFEFDLGGHRVVGQMDGIVRDLDDGRVWILEHKFTRSDTSPGSTYWEKLALDVQVGVYIDGATVLGHDVAGVIYDVIAKPSHKPRRATPLAERRLTKGSGCKHCGGSGGGKLGVQQGRGSVAVDGIERHCLACGGSELKRGTGWKEAPRLHADQRETDETVDEFETRIREDIATRPDDYYRRAVIVRTGDELPKLRADILQTIQLARIAETFDVHPRNPDACFQYQSRCFAWDACTGTADITDPIRFQRKAPRPEAAAPSQP